MSPIPPCPIGTGDRYRGGRMSVAVRTGWRAGARFIAPGNASHSGCVKRRKPCRGVRYGAEMLRRGFAALVAGAVGLGATAATAQTPGPPTSVVASTLLISGHGWGHGLGMSQWGANGYAQHGWTFDRILAHYYPGTQLGLEAYLKGVVPAEMPSNWQPEALKTQAVAARSYALSTRATGRPYDVFSDTRSQVYIGRSYEKPSMNAAVDATKGQVLLYR